MSKKLSAPSPGAPKAATTISAWQYPKCSTCRSALRWLDTHGVVYQSTNLVETPPSAATLRDLWKRSGLPLTRFFNTSGESYRNGGWKDRVKNVSDEEALAALSADGKLIKRPIIDTGARVLVGFDEAAYTATFG